MSDPPSFAAGVPVSVSTLVNTAASFPVTVTDPDTAGATLTLTGVTTNATLLPNGGIAVVPVVVDGHEPHVHGHAHAGHRRVGHGRRHALGRRRRGHGHTHGEPVGHVHPGGA